MSKSATPATRAAIQRVEGLRDKLRAAEQKVSGAVHGVHMADEHGPDAVAAAKAEAHDLRHAAARIENELHDARQAECDAWAEAPDKPFDTAAHVKQVHADQAARMRNYYPKA